MQAVTSRPEDKPIHDDSNQQQTGRSQKQPKPQPRQPARATALNSKSNSSSSRLADSVDDSLVMLRPSEYHGPHLYISLNVSECTPHAWQNCTVRPAARAQAFCAERLESDHQRQIVLAFYSLHLCVQVLDRRHSATRKQLSSCVFCQLESRMSLFATVNLVR